MKVRALGAILRALGVSGRSDILQTLGAIGAGAAPAQASHKPQARPLQTGGCQRHLAAGQGATGCPHMAKIRAGKILSPTPMAEYDVGGHAADTQKLFSGIGGLQGLETIARGFYKRFFEDVHLNSFIAHTHHKHPERIAGFMAQQMTGDERYYDDEVRQRVRYQTKGYSDEHGAIDFSHAHAMARSARKFGGNYATRKFTTLEKMQEGGDGFTIKDARIWMRLMFWSAREQRLAEDAELWELFVGYIRHKIGYYEPSKHPERFRQFATADAEWSASQDNLEAYVSNENVMQDLTDTS